VTVVLHGIRQFETPNGRIEAAAGKVAVLPARMPHRPVGLARATTSINLYLRPRRGAAVVPAAALVLQPPSWMALGTNPDPSPHYSREMRDQSQAVAIAHNYANGLFDEVFCNEISGPGVWWPGPISGGPMNYSG